MPIVDHVINCFLKLKILKFDKWYLSLQASEYLSIICLGTSLSCSYVSALCSGLYSNIKHFFYILKNNFYHA